MAGGSERTARAICGAVRFAPHCDPGGAALAVGDETRAMDAAKTARLVVTARSTLWNVPARAGE
jgi:hypothetical protein